MIDCSCYHDEINFLGKRGVCWGTKEREPCSCGGDAAECDFYPTVREKGKKPQTNADKIRAMSDEELAEFLWDVWRNKDPFYKECVDGWLVPFCHWLKQEAE